MGEILPDGSIQGYSTYCKKCKATIKTNMQGDYDEEHICLLTPENVSNIFKNINHKASNTPGYDYSFDVFNEKELIGELFYSDVFKEWCFIKDNFPAQRKAYRTDFPIKTIERFIDLFESIGIKLILNETK